MNEYESELEKYKELGLSLQESLDKMHIAVGILVSKLF